ncbi:MAG: bacterioferritin [Deltaproteobacteria bacterium]|nr:bacterioferritin [Deltaproteobacteria bacterium]
MKGNKKVIDALNEILTGELTGVNQYFVHSRMCRNWGYERLAKKSYDESISEMKHADDLIERILLLEGIPNMQRLWKVSVGETPVEQLRLDLALEIDAVKRLNDSIKLARDAGDNGTVELLEDMLTSEEEHVEWLEAQLELVRQLGDKIYLSQQIHS